MNLRLALAASFAFSASAQAQTTSKEIFTPVTNDLALTNLRKIAGCTVDAIWKSGACTDDRPFTAALAYFNIALLIVVVIFVAYMTYSMMADTANDGEIFGRSTDTRYTLLRAGIGAAFALPVKSGLSLIQLLVIQVAIWGSGAGDTMWAKVAANSLSGMYGSLPAITVNPGDYQLRKNLADALQVRVYGYVCKAALENYAKTVSGSDHPVTPDVVRTSRNNAYFSTDSVVSYVFKGDSYYRSSSSMCGSIEYRVISIDPKLTDDDGTNAKSMIQLAQTIGTQALSSAFASIDASASAIASRITSEARNEDAIKADIKTAVDNAFQSISTQLASLATSQSPQMSSILTQYLNASKDKGWLAAVLWQRSTTAIYAKMLSTVSGAKFTFSAPNDFTSYVPILSRYGAAYNALTDQAARDMEYIRTFDGYFASLGTPGAPATGSDDPAKTVSDMGVLGQVIASVYQGVINIISRDEASSWRDPILDIQEIGTAISYAAAPATVAGGIMSIFPSAAGTAGTFIMMIGLLLMGIAFMLAGVAPFLLVIHFFFGALNWFLAVAEALIAVPVWLLTKFMPSANPNMIGRSANGYLFFLGILLRPPLIIVGLLAALLLMRLSLDIANILFRGSLAMFSPDGQVAAILVGAAGITVYATVVFTIVGYSASLISSLPERVLSWIDHRVGQPATAGIAQGVTSRHMAGAAPAIGSTMQRATSTLTGDLRRLEQDKLRRAQ